MQQSQQLQMLLNHKRHASTFDYHFTYHLLQINHLGGGDIAAMCGLKRILRGYLDTFQMKNLQLQNDFQSMDGDSLHDFAQPITPPHPLGTEEAVEYSRYFTWMLIEKTWLSHPSEENEALAMNAAVFLVGFVPLDLKTR